MNKRMVSTGRVALSLIYVLLTGEAAVCSQERPPEQYTDRGSNSVDESDLVCGGDCQNVTSAAIPSIPSLAIVLPPSIGSLIAFGATPTPPSRHRSISRGPPAVR